MSFGVGVDECEGLAMGVGVNVWVWKQGKSAPSVKPGSVRTLRQLADHFSSW